MENDFDELAPGEQKANNSQHERGRQFELVKPPQFRKAGKIRDFDQICNIMLPHEDPSKMTIDEALLKR